MTLVDMHGNKVFYLSLSAERLLFCPSFSFKDEKCLVFSELKAKPEFRHYEFWNVYLMLAILVFLHIYRVRTHYCEFC